MPRLRLRADVSALVWLSLSAFVCHSPFMPIEWHAFSDPVHADLLTICVQFLQTVLAWNGLNRSLHVVPCAFKSTLKTAECKKRLRLSRSSFFIVMKSSFRPISTGQLHALLHFHLQPINLVVCKGSIRRSYLRGGFTLRCFQRLSFPNLATQRCPWQDNWYTRGLSIPVLSY